MEGREACIMPVNPGVHQSIKLCHRVEKRPLGCACMRACVQLRLQQAFSLREVMEHLPEMDYSNLL